jgi:predicted ATPase/DNA-binding CsgD family transcriptional regulator
MASPNLPQPTTPFVGRQHELAEIARLLADPDCRLLTLVGAGGSGKTRLALESARKTDFRDGVFFVPLQPLQSADQVTGTIINGLHLHPDEGTEPKQALLEYLREVNLLLVLDNFEHLLDASVLVMDMLSAALQVKLLVTSREPLKLHEEWVREVGGLTYPLNGEVTAGSNDSALLLFAERARRLKADFSLDEEYEHMVRICRLVDGLPLALELAAGWLRTLSCKAIAHELQYTLDFLASNVRNIPERHQSMRAVFDHSWHLLKDAEQAAIACFAVFRGGCTREAAEQVASTPLLVLAGLVEKSLLRHDPTTDRYDMQELVRQYAQEQLIALGTLEKARELHHAYYARHLQNLAENERAHPLEEIWNAVAADFDNVQVAWMWAVEHHHWASLETMASLIWEYAASSAKCFEALGLYEAARAMLADCAGDANRSVLGQIIGYLGMCHGGLLHWERSEFLSGEALVIAREEGNPTQIGLVVLWLTIVFWHRGKAMEAIHLSSDFVASYREACPPRLLGNILKHLGDFAGGVGRSDVRHQLYQDSLALLRGAGDRRALGDLFLSLSRWALSNGQWDRAESYLADCQNFFVESQHLKGMNSQRACFAQLIMAKGHFEGAQHLAEAALVKAKKSELLSMVKNCAGALGCLSLLADARGDHEAAHQQAKEALHYAQRSGDLFALMPVKFALGWTLVSQENDAQALDYLLDFLETALLWEAEGDMLYALGGLARILAHQGERVRTIELLGLIFTHPNSPVGYFENYPPFRDLRTTLEADLGPEGFAAAWRRGIQLDVERVAQELLRAFTAGVNNPTPPSYQPLADPLTPRELEILQYMSAGLTNREIADQLVISISTVKKHISHLYDKLGASDRINAINRARALDLLPATTP